MHPSQVTLNDYVDGVLDPTEQSDVDRHVATCAECALFVAELQLIVRDARALPPMQPPPEAWARLQERLKEKPSVVEMSRPLPRRWAPVRPGAATWALATAALIVLAFLTGRVVEQRQQRQAQTQQAQVSTQPGGVVTAGTTASAAADAAGARQRILLVAVGDHLERSQMILVELTNAHTQGQLDISAERESADELLASNRLYRQTAVQLGDTNVAGVLDELERVLVEVARGPSQLSMEQLADIQQRIEAQGILFKVRVIGSDIRERGNSTITGRKAPVS